MKSFWRKPEKDDASNESKNHSRAECRFTVGLARAEQLALMLAQSRAARFVEVADMLAGMYIYEWDRLSRFWSDRGDVEELLCRICRISPQRWHHWIEVYDQQRRQQEKGQSSLVPRSGFGPKRPTADTACEKVMLQHSIELKSILQSARDISPFRDDLDGRAIPVLTAECVLLSIARNTDSEVSRKLRETGLDLAALERAARDPRRAPHR